MVSKAQMEEAAAELATASLNRKERDAAELLITLARSAAPSGQVAEDEDKVSKCIPSGQGLLWDEERAALSRLAAGAQRTRRAELERDEARARVSALHAASGCTAMHTALTAEAGCAADAILAARAEVERLKGTLATEEAERVRCRDGWAQAQREAEEQRKRADAAEGSRDLVAKLAEDRRQRLEALEATVWRRR